MDGLAIADLKSVVAPLNFLAPMAEKPYSYNYEPPPGVPAAQPARAKSIRCRSATRARSSAGCRSTARASSCCTTRPRRTDFYDEDEITSVYYPECERLIKEATGAARVVAFDHIVRNAAQWRRVKGSGIKMPARRVHNDYTAWSAPQRVRDLMGDEAEELLKHRFAIINVWRPISGPLLRSPLALCDAQSLCRRRIWSPVRSALSRPHRRDLRGHLQPEPALVLFPEDAAGRGGADPLLRLGAPRARRGSRRIARFDDPTTPPDAPPRESIEVRTLVFFPPGV